MFRIVSHASKWLFALSLVLGAGACVVGGDEEARDEGFAEDKNADREDARIVGGVDANIADYPWQISLQSSAGSHFCGGSILNEEWILTANHCVDGSAAASMRIAAGISKRSESDSGQIRDVAEIIMYPDYTSPDSGKDVALLKLAAPLDLTAPGVSAIAIITAADAAAGLDNPGVIATVSGWGTLSAGGNLPDTLQRVEVPLLSNEDAQRAYTGETITGDQLAAGYVGVGGRDSCQGDSGGPLVVANADQSSYVLAGVVSWGYGCADPNYPGMYARVSSFADWIQTTVGNTGGGGDGGGEPPATDIVIDERDLSGARREWLDFTIDVPAGTGSVDVVMSGGEGDADLYVRYDQLPTTGRYDCRSYRSTNDEACTIDAPSAGVWYVSVRGYSTFSGANLIVRTNP